MNELFASANMNRRRALSTAACGFGALAAGAMAHRAAAATPTAVTPASRFSGGALDVQAIT